MNCTAVESPEVSLGNSLCPSSLASFAVFHALLCLVTDSVLSVSECPFCPLLLLVKPGVFPLTLSSSELLKNRDQLLTWIFSLYFSSVAKVTSAPVHTSLSSSANTPKKVSSHLCSHNIFLIGYVVPGPFMHSPLHL